MIDGIIKEVDETAGEIEDKAVLDAANIANAQAVEHYEMCRYGAEALGHNEIVRFLTTNLNEEKAANTKLNTVAQRKGLDGGLIYLQSGGLANAKPLLFTVFRLIAVQRKASDIAVRGS